MWKSRGHRDFLNQSSKYTPFELSQTHLGDLNLVGFEEAIERSVKRVCKCHLETLPDLLFEKKQIECLSNRVTSPNSVSDL